MNLVKEIKTLSLKSATAFGPMAIPVVLKVFSINMPREGAVASLPHNLRNISNVASIDSLTVIRSAMGQRLAGQSSNVTTIMGQTNVRKQCTI